MNTSTEIVSKLRAYASGGVDDHSVLDTTAELIEDLEGMLLAIRNESWSYLFVDTQQELDAIIEKWSLDK